MSGKLENQDSQREIEAILGVDSHGFRTRRWRNKLLFVGLLVVVLGLGYRQFTVNGSADGLHYSKDPASRADITVIVTATGTVEPTEQVEISSELSGIIRTVAVDYNSQVKVGQVLAELDTDKLKATVESSRAKRNAARARVTETEATVVEKQHELARARTLAQRQSISTQDLDSAQAAYARALASLASTQADVKAAEADLKLNETNLEKTCICSPIDGVVLNRNVDPGQVVAASLQAPVLFTIAKDLKEMEVRVDVDEADVGQVQQDQTATFTVDAYPDRHFQARIKVLRFGSEVVQGVVTYKAVLTTNNAELLLRPGMTATAQITVREEMDVLTVSNEALRFSPPVADVASDQQGLLTKLIPGRPQFRAPSQAQNTGPQRELWVLRDDGTIESVKVTVGVTDGKRTQIVNGAIKAGQDVVIDVLAPST